MVNIRINGKAVSAASGSTILAAAASAGIEIPHLCYLEGINEIGACRVCVVEVKGVHKLIPACECTVEEGMEIETNSPRVREARRVNVQLILSQHDCTCATCVRSGNCVLQTLANDLGITEAMYEKQLPKNNWPKDFPLIREESKCVKCMRCVQVCENIQHLGIWDVLKSASRTTVGVRGNQPIQLSKCALCGQCVTHCPVGALRERDDASKLTALKGALADPEKITIVQVAPAIRAAWGEGIGLTREEATPEKLAAALKALGFDYVFDTNFGADLTIMEEGSELLERLAHKEEYAWPMFTSCCPGWVRFVKGTHPELTANLSTAKSPHQMQGALMKTYFAEKLGVDPDKIYNISIMPCVAKKAESAIPNINDAGHGRDVDMVLTTRELDRLLRADHVNVKALEGVPFDSPFGSGTGAAVIFGVTGGVMEAALRSCSALVTGKNPDPYAFSDVRGMDGWREAKFDLNGAEVRVAVASGLGNTEKLIRAIQRGEAQYDFVEIMACPGGCAGGGGQPIHEGEELAQARGDNLYFLDRGNAMRFSHENPDVLRVYEEFLEKPLSHKAHELLHTDHGGWEF